MGYDLTSKTGDDFRWASLFWGRVLALADKYGWKSRGTVIPDDYGKKEWDGNYFFNSRQKVDAEDAKSLADALEKALEHLPKDEVVIPKPEYSRDPNTRLPKIANWENIPLEDFFSGPEGRQTIVDFIAFCRKGEFEIG